MRYSEAKQRAKTRNTKPSLTDQSQALQTDRNVIVHRFLKTGMAPGGKDPMYADFSRLPTTLAGFLHQAKSLDTLRKRLPKPLQGYSTTDLLALKPDELRTILEPPAKPAGEKPKDEQK